MYVKGIHFSLSLLTGIYLHINMLVRELEFGLAEPQVLCRVYKLYEVWDGKGELLKEEHLELLEVWGSDLMNNCFHISANALEPEVAEVRKNNMSLNGICNTSFSTSRLGTGK